MKQIFNSLLFAVLACTASPAGAQSVYQKPPADVVKIVEAPPTPFVSVSPEKDALMLVDYNPNPGIEVLARPVLKLAGIRIDPEQNSRQRITEFKGITLRWLDSGKELSVILPAKGRLAGVPRWAPNGRRIAFGIDTEQGVELWSADTRTGKSARVGNFYVNDLLGSAFDWMEDSERLFVKQIPAGRGPLPPAQKVPSGPNIEESFGKKSPTMTFQDMLKSESDEKQFAFLANTQLAIVNVVNGKSLPIGKPGLYMGAEWSPDEQYLLLTEIKKPFSYRVQYSLFARTTMVWDKNGKRVYTVSDSGVSDEIPRQGVVTGPRQAGWQALHGAKLYWAEALDGGDPKQKAAFRDKIMTLSAPFTAAPAQLMQLRYRYSGFEWTAQKDLGLVTEYDRDRRWIDVWKVDLNNASKPDTMFSLSANDDYANPGDPVYQRLPNGEYVIAQEGDWLFFSTEGASPEGSYPRLDKYNLKTREKTTVFKAQSGTFEEFIAFAGKDFSAIITRYQTKTEPPNFYQMQTSGAGRKALTTFKDPAPEMTNISKQLVKYKRNDGVPLSGTLYLPATYQKGQRLPLFIWAYPLEYSDASTAGQVRDSDNRFTFYRGDSPLFFVTQGYAVLMDATVPVVGDPETMNNTFVEQITAGGKAAIDHLDSLGIIDRKRVGVGGHSYGAFMTANLLAHSDDYAYGIARSGAYNRTLTPFGFQSERRSFWEAKDIYMNLSPFTHAHKINEPLLIIHGEADNNPGTFTIQSERLFQAIKGNGGTARLVLLPYESHGYRARESVEHVLYEMFEWAKK